MHRKRNGQKVYIYHDVLFIYLFSVYFMLKLNTQKALKLILLFALLNSSIFIVLHPSGALRLLIAGLMNISGVLLIIYFFKISKRKFDANLYFKIIFFLLISWSLYTIFRSFALDSKTLMTLFGH